MMQALAHAAQCLYQHSVTHLKPKFTLKKKKYNLFSDYLDLEVDVLGN